jgi:hypothetical protein
MPTGNPVIDAAILQSLDAQAARDGAAVEASTRAMQAKEAHDELIEAIQQQGQEITHAIDNLDYR